MSGSRFLVGPPPARRFFFGVDYETLVDALDSAGPALLFGLRLWVAVCLALFIAFWLELDHALWAGTSAVIVCQPSLGASLRKASFRMVGTVVGAVAIVVLTALFVQNRPGFLVGLALWGAACGFVGTILQSFAAYAAVLAGYTAAIVASDTLGATGGANGEVFMLAVTRASEICIGIVSAGLVLALTEFGDAPRRLTAQLAALVAEIAAGLVGSLSNVGPRQAETRPLRRELSGRIVALGSLVEEAIAESTSLYYRLPALRTSINGLFAALSGWRAVANCLERLSERDHREIGFVLTTLPQELRLATTQGTPSAWAAESLARRRVCLMSVRALVAMPANSPVLRLLADGTAEAILGLTLTLGGLAMIVDPTARGPSQRRTRRHVPDLLPAFVNGSRVFMTIAAIELFWLVTAWPHGATAVAFATIVVLLFSPRDNQAYAGAKNFGLGIAFAVPIAGIAKFALLPNCEGFTAFAFVLGLVLVPFGALSTHASLGPMFGAMAFLFLRLVAPNNYFMTYDTVQFYNTALAMLTGAGFAMLAIALVPPLPAAVRVRRALASTLRDLRRLADGSAPHLSLEWESRVYDRLASLPAGTPPLPLAQFVAALSVGAEIVRLRRIAHRFDLISEVDTALQALAKADSGTAIARLAEMDRTLVAFGDGSRGARARLRARGSIRALSEALRQHRVFFDSRDP